MYGRRIAVAALSLLVLSLGVRAVELQKDSSADKRSTSGVNYKISGNVDVVPGQSFPKSWGHLASYVVASNQGGGIREQRFVFEADDGTIRVVKADLNWSSDKIDDVEVITIGRD